MEVEIEKSVTTVCPSRSTNRSDHHHHHLSVQFDSKLNFSEDKEQQQQQQQRHGRGGGQVKEVFKPEYDDEDAAAAAEEDEQEDDDCYEFSFVCSAEAIGSPISAEEIFHNGQIKPYYPSSHLHPLPHPHPRSHSSSSSSSSSCSSFSAPLDHVLLVQQPDPPLPDSSAADDDPAVATVYCLWRPADPCRKSTSTTGFSRLRRFREMLLQRSHSEAGRDALVFVDPSKPNTKKEEEEAVKADADADAEAEECKSKSVPEKSKATSSEKEKVKGKTVSSGIPYGNQNNNDNNNNSSSSSSGKERGDVREKEKEKEKERRRKSYLPYRQDLVGFFTSTALSRNVHPY